MLAAGRDQVVALDRKSWTDPNRLGEAFTEVEAVLHFAGVNRDPDDQRLGDNVTLAEALTAALDRAGATPNLVYANSIQSGNGTSFGLAKQRAAEHLRTWGQKRGARVADVRLPNLFGEHGRPHYNSVVATFSSQLANNEPPRIIEDRQVELLHVQDAIDQMIRIAVAGDEGEFRPLGTSLLVSDLLVKLQTFSDMYRNADFPDTTSPFDRALFNTYRSFCFPEHFPFYPDIKSDTRGGLFECVRAHGGLTQVFCSSTHPGVTRGNHFHLHKIERFVVVQGEATISLRRLFHQDVVRFKVSGDRPSLVDMPTMWTHSITNTGRHDLVTLFWADEIPENGHSDTYAEVVESLAKPA